MSAAINARAAAKPVNVAWPLMFYMTVLLFILRCGAGLAIPWYWVIGPLWIPWVVVLGAFGVFAAVIGGVYLIAKMFNRN